jgi:hypothetical protein
MDRVCECSDSVTTPARPGAKLLGNQPAGETDLVQPSSYLQQSLGCSYGWIDNNSNHLDNVYEKSITCKRFTVHTHTECWSEFHLIGKLCQVLQPVISYAVTCVSMRVWCTDLVHLSVVSSGCSDSCLKVHGSWIHGQLKGYGTVSYGWIDSWAG